MTLCILLLDKEFPPKHSFVDGFLCNRMFRRRHVTYALLPRGPGVAARRRRYKGLLCDLCLPARKGLGRLLSYGAIVARIVPILSRRRTKGGAVVFVRNDPIYLFAAITLKWMFPSTRVVYQNSFPLEILERHTPKGRIASAMLRVACRCADLVLVVSDLAAKRLAGRYRARRVLIVPLCPDGSFMLAGDVSDIAARKYEQFSGSRDLELVYIGTHDRSRGLEFVIGQIRIAGKRLGRRIRLVTYGASEEDKRRILADPQCRALERDGGLRIHGLVDRDRVPELLDRFSLGLSLIPPHEYFREASPTKLGEYMSRGVVPIANIEMFEQKRVMEDSGGCVMCEYDGESIIRAIVRASELGPDQLRALVSKSIEYVRAEYRYSIYIERYLKSMPPDPAYLCH